MPSMTDCRRGDVVLGRFVFSDDSGAKLRPAVVVSSTGYHRSRREVIVAAITSNVKRRLFGEHNASFSGGAPLLRADRCIPLFGDSRCSPDAGRSP